MEKVVLFILCWLPWRQTRQEKKKRHTSSSLRVRPLANCWLGQTTTIGACLTFFDFLAIFFPSYCTPIFFFSFTFFHFFCRETYLFFELLGGNEQATAVLLGEHKLNWSISFVTFNSTNPDIVPSIHKYLCNTHQTNMKKKKRLRK